MCMNRFQLEAHLLFSLVKYSLCTYILVMQRQCCGEFMLFPLEEEGDLPLGFLCMWSERKKKKKVLRFKNRR